MPVYEVQPARATAGTAAVGAVIPGTIRVTRRLSIDGEPLVSPGDCVEAEDALLTMSTFPGKVLHEDLARDLRVAPAETERCLLHPPGTMVAAGQVIGRSSMFWQHRIARSTNEGSVAGVSPSLGVVYLREHLPTQLAETVRINIVEELRGDKNHFHSYLRVKEGDAVEKGQVLATLQEASKFRNVTSPVYGKVTTIVPLMGSMAIIPDKVSSVLLAHVPGTVAAIHGGREVDLIGYGVAFDGLIGIGGEARGMLLAAANDAEPWRSRGAEEAALSGKVLVAGNVDCLSLREAARLGVSGVIAGQAHQGEVTRFLGRELGVIATGDEDVTPVLILTEGFGKGGMDPALFGTLAGLQGRLASLSGTTHIRAGVIRPRVIVSFPMPPGLKLEIEGPGSGPGDLGGGNRGGDRGRYAGAGAYQLAVGARVKVLRGPWAGRTGTVRELPGQPQTIATGAPVLVARVEFGGSTGTGTGTGRPSPGERGAGGQHSGELAQAVIPQANLKPEVQGA